MAGRLLERDCEEAAIAEAVAAVRGGESRLVLVEGPAGVGKSRLISLAGERARDAGFSGLVARGSEMERSFAFGVVRQLLAPALAALAPGERRSVLCGQARMAARPLALEHEPSQVQGDALDAAFGGLFWLCVALAERAPLLLAVDDAHWCDQASLDWLCFLVARFEGVSILVVLAYRLSEPGAEVPGSIVAQARPGLSEILAPRPLSRAAVADLLSAASEIVPAERFVEACYRASRGNPFLVQELLRQIAAARIEPTGANAEVAALGSRRVSESVLARVRRLGEDALALTCALAVLGDRVKLSHALALAELDRGRGVTAAAALVDAGVLVEGFPLEFAHPLVRSAIYEQLAYAERLAYHARAARILADTGARAETVAAHLLITPPGEDGWTVAVLRTAAADAARQGSPRDAALLLRRALIEPPAPSVRGEVLAELGIDEHNAGERQAIEHLAEALELTCEKPARAAVGLALARAIWHTGEIAQAVALLHRLAGEVDEDLAAPLQAELVAIARLDPSTRQIGLRVLEGARDRPGSDRARLLLLGNLAFERAVCGQASVEDVTGLVERALAGGRLLEQVGSENTIYHLAAWALAQYDRFDQAERALQAAIEQARREGSAAGFARALNFRCNLCYRRGLLAEAHADGMQSLEHMTSIRAPLEVAFLLDVLIETDELQDAQKLLERFQLDGELPDSILHTILLERRGRLRIAQSRPRQALADLLACRQASIAWGAGSPAFLAWRSSTALALALADRDRIDEARRLAAEEVERAQALGARRALGVALRAKALLSDRPRDIALLEQAERTLRDSGAILEHARVLVDLGAALRRAGQRTAAREQLRAGMRSAERCRAHALAARARTELRSAGARPIRLDLQGIEALSPSELRVAKLAATGITNHEIAQSLFVVPKTVEWHIANIYRKLGVHSRSQLADALAHQDRNTPS